MVGMKYPTLASWVQQRRKHRAGATEAVPGAVRWGEAVAEPESMGLAGRGETATCLVKDGDTKFTAKFDEVFKSEGITVKRLPYASPNLNAHAERFVQSIKNECLDQFVVFGERHLDFLLREYEDHYNTVRPHQGLGSVPLNLIPLPGAGPPVPAEIECDSRLGGLLRHDHRRAAA